MTPIDWILVVLLNGGCIALGLIWGRGAQTSADWFLAGRSLPWWVVGLSLYATAIDSSDLVADSGGIYTLGLTYFVTNWVGTVVGWVLAANVLIIPMYRLGMYTNAEYLEARFGTATRVISALVQVQYRTMVLGIIANTLFLTLAIVCGWGQSAWYAVVLIAFIATLYTMWGGLKSVAITDAFQSLVMLAAAFVLFGVVWNNVGGFDGAREKLSLHDAELPAQLLHVGHDQVKTTLVTEKTREEIDRLLLLGGQYDAETQSISRTTPAWLVCLALVIAGMAYSIVNHTQSMRMLGSRSEWDLKMSVVVAAGIILIVTFLNLTMGAFGRAIYPDPTMMPLVDVSLQKPDSIYPLLVRDLLPSAAKGLVVAGILAASFSTFDSIGSTLSALITRDIYARIIHPEGEDGHYLRFGRWLTPVIIFGSFAYVPFLQGQGMLLFYLDLVGAFVVPLLTVYLMGALTAVHPKSGFIGLMTGVLYGVMRLVAPFVAEHMGVAILPAFMTDGFAAYPCSVLTTAIPMVVVSMWYGWQQSDQLKHEEVSGWLRTSQKAALEMGKGEVMPASSYVPLALGVVMIVIGMVLSFSVFW